MTQTIPAPNRWTSDAFPDENIGRQVADDYRNNMRYKVHPITGWRAEPNQSHQSVTTNEHGLRAPRDMLKRAHENRVLLLGGSFAWGWGATSDATAPGSLIEVQLNEESSHPVSLINLAEAGFTSLQEVQSCLTAIDELGPKIIVCVTGYNDVWVSTFGGYVDHPRNREIIAHFDWAITTGLVRPQSHLKRVAKIFRLMSQFLPENRKKR